MLTSGSAGADAMDMANQKRIKITSKKIFLKEFTGTNWKDIKNNVDSTFQCFTDKIINAIQNSTSLIVDKLTPWLSSELIELANEKAAVYKLLNEYPENNSFKFQKNF